MDGCGLKKICFIYRYYHPYLHKSRFVCPLKPKSFNPCRKLLMPDTALEDLAVHQFCAFAARRKAFVRLADATPTGGCKRDDRLAGQVIAFKKNLRLAQSRCTLPDRMKLSSKMT